MIVTEEEAQHKFCPMQLSHRDPHRPQHCLGSYCMAWRIAFTGSINNPTRQQNTGFGRTEIGGYCGLVGKPE